MGASCRDEDPDLFFPLGSVFERELQVRAAKAVCALCPVREECLTTAVALHVVDGVWGGLTHEERLTARRVRRAS